MHSNFGFVGSCCLREMFFNLQSGKTDIPSLKLRWGSLVYLVTSGVSLHCHETTWFC